MVQMIREKTQKSQIGSSPSAGAAYNQGGGDISFANGQYILFRMPTAIPKGSTIIDATLMVNINANKNGGTTQTCLNSLRAHASGDSPVLLPGSGEPSSRSWTAARLDWPMTWPANPPGNVNLTLNVKPIIDEIMARSDYVSGAYITFMLYTDNENGSDLAIRANNDFLPTPKLTVNFTPPVTETQTLINICENSELNTALNPVNTAQVVPYWDQNSFFGYMVEPANWGTIARDSAFTRLPGIPSLRFTCGTPPAETSKRTGPVIMAQLEGGRQYGFACWVYLPATIPVTSNRVLGGDIYNGQAEVVAPRGVWTPFASQILTRPDFGSCWFGVDINNFQAGWQFWISEPTIYYSSFKHMPFNGLTPDRKESGDATTLVDYASGVSAQQARRIFLPRKSMLVGGVPKRVPTYRKRLEGMMEIAEPVKGGPTSTAMPAVRIDSLPADKTIAEL